MASDNRNYWNRRINRRRTLAGGASVALGAAGLAFAGCGDDDDANGTPPATGAAQGNATQGAAAESRKPPSGDLKVLINFTIGLAFSANPFRTRTGQYVDAAFGSQWRFSDKGEREFDLAQSMEDVDRSTFIFKTRPGAKFWDGTEVTAEDHIFSIEQMIATPGLVGAPFKLRYDSAVAIDKNTFSLKLKTPSAFQLVDLYNGNGWPVTSKAYFNRVGSEQFDRQSMGTGPFKYVRGSAQDFVELEANELYWDQARIPRAKTLRIDYIPEEATRIARLQTGEANLAEAISPERVDSLSKDGFKAYGNPSQVLGFFRIGNIAEPPFNDIRVREAMMIAIDQEALLKTIVRPGSPSRGVLMFPHTPGFKAEDWPARPYNLERAKQLIQQAGVQGTTIKFPWTQTRYPSIPQLIEFAAASWEKIGLKVERPFQDPAPYYEGWPRGDFDKPGTLLIGAGNTSGSDTPGLIIIRNRSDYPTTFFPRPVPGYDAHADKIVAAKTTEEQTQLGLEGMRKFVYDQWNFMAMPYLDTVFVGSKAIKAYRPIPGTQPAISALHTAELA